VRGPFGAARHWQATPTIAAALLILSVSGCSPRPTPARSPTQRILVTFEFDADVACFPHPQMVFTNSANRVLATSKISLVFGIQVVGSTPGTMQCFASGQLSVSLPREARYYARLQPTGLRFGPVTYASLRANGWHWKAAPGDS
jgi:hypothetical protein